MDFTQLIDLAAERLGAAAVLANDEFFAAKENLIKASAPVWLEGEYTERGKWMDGWETRRRREPGYDWCIVRLGRAGVIRGVVIDTSYFTGNYPETCSLDAATIGGVPDPARLTSGDIAWREMRTTCSSIGCRSASSACGGNSPSSSRNSTPRCASVTSPGRSRFEPPPTSAAVDAV